MASPYTGTTQDRIKFAADHIGKGRAPTRTFDTCFEMGDGDEVVRGLMKRAKKNPRLAEALPRYIRVPSEAQP